MWHKVIKNLFINLLNIFFGNEFPLSAYSRILKTIGLKFMIPLDKVLTLKKHLEIVIYLFKWNTKFTFRIIWEHLRGFHFKMLLAYDKPEI